MKEVFHYDSGNVQHREWILNLEDGGAIRADAPNGSVINRNQFRKFGFKVAELVATMRPLTDAEAMEKAA